MTTKKQKFNITLPNTFEDAIEAARERQAQFGRKPTRTDVVFRYLADGLHRDGLIDEAGNPTVEGPEEEAEAA